MPGGEGAARRLLVAPDALLKGEGRMRRTLPCTDRKSMLGGSDN